MPINSVTQISPYINKSQHNLKFTPAEAHATFSSNLKQAITELNNSQKLSDKKTEALAKGEIDNLHDVMVTAKKASVTLQTSVEIQGKVIESYREIMRMQV